MSATIGVDVGQVHDATAIVVVETYRPEPEPPAFKYLELRHVVHWCDKVPLGTNYVDVADEVARVVKRAASLGHAILVVDNTGVGRPFTDLLGHKAGISMRTVTFTSGESESQDGTYGHRVPKRDLMTALRLVIETHRITVMPTCPFRADLMTELQNIDFTIAERTGHDRYEAAPGFHDDLVMALALAIWWAERPSAAALDAWMHSVRRRTDVHRDWR